MRKKSIIEKYGVKYKGDQSDNVVLHLELKELERTYKKEKRYDKQTKNLFEEINIVLCHDIPNLELIVYDLVDLIKKLKKKKTSEDAVKWYGSLRNTDSRNADYLEEFIKD